MLIGNPTFLCATLEKKEEECSAIKRGQKEGTRVAKNFEGKQNLDFWKQNKSCKGLHWFFLVQGDSLIKVCMIQNLLRKLFFWIFF